MPPLKEPQFAPEINPTVTVTRKKVAGVSQPEDRHVAKEIPRDMPFLLDGDFLIVTNHGSHPEVFRWARKAYVIEPGQSKHVIFEALVDQLGDPRSMDNEIVQYNDGNGSRGIVMKRHDELSRLFARYAIENESIDSLVQKTPNVSVETLNGDKVTFPGLRPDMLPFPAPKIDKQAVDTDSKRMVDQLREENEQMRERQAQLEERMDAMIAQREGVSEGA